MRDLLKIDIIKNRLLNYFENNEKVSTVYIFGSFGTENETAMSDIDIAILYDTPVSVYEESGYSGEISSLLLTDKVDTISLNSAPIYIQHEVLYTGVKIFERAPRKTMDFVEGVLEMYHDYEIIFRKYREEYVAALKEEYQGGR